MATMAPLEKQASKTETNALRVAETPTKSPKSMSATGAYLVSKTFGYEA